MISRGANWQSRVSQSLLISTPIQHWLKVHHGLSVTKNDSRLIALRSRVDAEYEAGWTTAISDEEMHAWHREAFGG